MEEYYDTNREEGSEAMDVEGIDRPMGNTSHNNGPPEGAMESGMSVCTTEGHQDSGVGGETNLDHDQRQRSSARVPKPRIVYLAEIEAAQQLRGSDGKGQRKGQGEFGLQVVVEGRVGRVLYLFDWLFFSFQLDFLYGTYSTAYTR